MFGPNVADKYALAVTKNLGVVLAKMKYSCEEKLLSSILLNKTVSKQTD